MQNFKTLLCIAKNFDAMNALNLYCNRARVSAFTMSSFTSYKQVFEKKTNQTKQNKNVSLRKLINQEESNMGVDSQYLFSVRADHVHER